MGEVGNAGCAGDGGGQICPSWGARGQAEHSLLLPTLPLDVPGNDVTLQSKGNPLSSYK